VLVGCRHPRAVPLAFRVSAQFDGLAHLPVPTCSASSHKHRRTKGACRSWLIVGKIIGLPAHVAGQALSRHHHADRDSKGGQSPSPLRRPSPRCTPTTRYNQLKSESGSVFSQMGHNTITHEDATVSAPPPPQHLHPLHQRIRSADSQRLALPTVHLLNSADGCADGIVDFSSLASSLLSIQQHFVKDSAAIRMLSLSPQSPAI
jgi:hypothetical protein